MPVHFMQYLPNSEPMITSQVKDQCNTQIYNYQNHHGRSGSQATRDLCCDALNCILDSLDATTTANLQSANVLLGLTPTMLSLIGNNPSEVALLSFSGHRILAFLLSIGAPVISATGAFKNSDPLKILKASTCEKPTFPRLSRIPAMFLLFEEYLFSAAAAVNVALLASEISTKAVYVPNCRRTWCAFLWMYLCLLLHPLSLSMFAARVRIPRPASSSPSCSSRFWKLGRETQDCASYTGLTFSLKKKEFHLFLFLDWLVSHGAGPQIIFGTLVLSSTTLIDIVDAFTIIGRYAASAIVCRLILLYELNALRAIVAATSPIDSTVESLTASRTIKPSSR